MDELRQQVARARRRLLAQQFLSLVGGCLFATLLVAAVGLAIPKLWVVPVEPAVWLASWLGGAVAVGLLLAAVWAFLIRAGVLDVAVEVDHRCGLQERICSSLSLTPQELDSEAGRALLEDTLARVKRIEVADRFPVKVSWRAVLPVLPALAIFALAVLVPDAVPQPDPNAAAAVQPEAARVQRSAEELKKRLASSEKKVEEKGLKDVDLLLKELQKGLDEVAKRDGADRKQALVKINEVAKSLEERREQLGGLDKLRQQWDKLKDLAQGPADKVAQAIQEGDLQTALEELKKLQETLRGGELTDEQKAQLAKQLEQFQNKLQQLVENHQQAKQDLEQEIQRRKAAGDLEGAGQLQRQLDQMNQLNKPMERLQRMAESLGQCRQCLQQGDGAKAAADLDQLVQSLQEMQAEMGELEAIDEILEQIADAKEAMACQHCNGRGCEACMGGFGNMGNEEGEPGMGLGEGRGKGDRPEAKTDTSLYESQVRGQVQRGPAVRTGSTGGPNRPGQSAQDVRDVIQGNLSQGPDPLTDVHLPRSERQQLKEYTQRLNQK